MPWRSFLQMHMAISSRTTLRPRQAPSRGRKAAGVRRSDTQQADAALCSPSLQNAKRRVELDHAVPSSQPSAAFSASELLRKRLPISYHEKGPGRPGDPGLKVAERSKGQYCCIQMSSRTTTEVASVWPPTVSRTT
jgi:hypothetical protein